MSEGIQTLHPTGKKGGNISKEKYDVVKAAIIKALQAQGKMTFYGLNDEVGRQQLEGKFEGLIGWYYTTVKLDLEAREMIEHFGKSPQRLRLTSN